MLPGRLVEWTKTQRRAYDSDKDVWTEKNIVKGKGFFHRFATEGASNVDGGEWIAVAIVEMPDGSVETFDVNNIKFLDAYCTECYKNNQLCACKK